MGTACGISINVVYELMRQCNFSQLRLYQGATEVTKQGILFFMIVMLIFVSTCLSKVPGGKVGLRG